MFLKYTALDPETRAIYSIQRLSRFPVAYGSTYHHKFSLSDAFTEQPEWHHREYDLAALA